jgi:hypothetical protein
VAAKTAKAKAAQLTPLEVSTLTNLVTLTQIQPSIPIILKLKNNLIMKSIKSIFLMVALFTLSASLSFGQTKKVKKMQKTRNYEYVMADWQKNAIPLAKASNKNERRKIREGKKNPKFLSRLEKVRAKSPRRKDKNLSGRN